MVAGGSYRLLEWSSCVAARNHANIAPQFIGIQTVQAVAGYHAGLAADAGIETDLKRVSLTFSGFAERHQVTVVFLLSWSGIPVVLLTTALHGAQRLLLGEKLIDQVGRKKVTIFS